MIGLRVIAFGRLRAWHSHPADCRTNIRPLKHRTDAFDLVIGRMSQERTPIDCHLGLARTGRRRLFTAHTLSNRSGVEFHASGALAGWGRAELEVWN